LQPADQEVESVSRRLTELAIGRRAGEWLPV